jgi:hypothetical protein
MTQSSKSCKFLDHTNWPRRALLCLAPDVPDGLLGGAEWCLNISMSSVWRPAGAPWSWTGVAGSTAAFSLPRVLGPCGGVGAQALVYT